jgi:hypothetical protein
MPAGAGCCTPRQGGRAFRTVADPSRRANSGPVARRPAGQTRTRGAPPGNAG